MNYPPPRGAVPPYRLTEESGLAPGLPGARSSLTDHAPMEQLDASPETEDERGAEREGNGGNGIWHDSHVGTADVARTGQGLSVLG